jgi:tetratricopeptide (TPR) repeat protein
VESQGNRSHPNLQQSLNPDNLALANGRAASGASAASSTAHITQYVQGDRNQVIGSVSGGNVFGNVENLNQYIQQAPPRFLSKHQLPPDIADFTGRTQEQERLLVTLRQENPRKMVAISGMAGTGKSALAIRVAYALSAEFDEVQLYVNLRGAEDHQALDPATVLVDWLRALGLDDASIPAELEGRVAAYRSLLQGKRAIVLLDNTQNEDQIRPLLPNSATCAVLVTSRKKLVALQGTTFLELPVLPEDDALCLIKTLSGTARIDAEPEQAKAMLALCGWLPLAIRIAAGTLNKPSQQRKALAEYVCQLQDEKQRLSQLNLDCLEDNLDVRTSFNLSYRELSDDLADCFRWLGLLEAPDFGAAVTAVLTETSEETAQQRIDALIDAQLLEVVSENRYRLHDLLRLFAREQLEQIELLEQQANARQRIIQYFLEWSGFMDSCLHPRGRREIAESWITADRTLSLEQAERSLEQRALAWFEQERSILLMLMEWISAAQGWEYMTRLSFNLALFLDWRCYWLDAEQLHRQALNAIRWLGNSDEEGGILNNLGLVYQYQGKWNESIDCYQQSLQTFRTIDDVHGEGQSLNNLGLVYQYQGKWNESIDCYQQSLQIKRTIGDVHGEGQSLNNLGLVYQHQGKWNESIDCYQQSLQTFRTIGDVFGEGQTLNNLGNLYQSQGKWSEAIDSYEQSLQICCTIGDVHGEGATLNNLGAVYDSQGKWNEAIDCYQQSLQTFRTIGDVSGEGQTLNNLGNLYQSQGKWSEAIDCYQQSLKIKRTIGDVHNEGITLKNLGWLYQKRGRFMQMTQYWQDAIEKLRPDSREYRQLYAMLHPSRQMIFSAVGMLVLAAIALTFIVSNLLAGRWLVALIILLATVTARFVLKAIQHQR